MAKTETIIKEMYGGKVKIAFYPKSHRYKDLETNEWIKSVSKYTGLIDKSGALLWWAQELSRNYLKQFEGETLTSVIIDTAVTQHSKEKDSAADTGHLAHEWFEQYAKAKIHGFPEPEVSTEMSSEVLNGIMAFLKWNNENKVEYLESERLVYSKKYNYVGTLDCIARINGELTLLDFKTGKNVYPEMFLQVSAYAEAYMEEIETEYITKHLILNLNKETGEFKTYEKDFFEIDYSVFTDLIKLDNFLKKHKI